VTESPGALHGGVGIEVEPPEAQSVFGEALPRAREYVRLLVTEGVQRGVIGPREPERIWSRHLLNAAQLTPLVPASARVVDIGSGAGIPGVPLALARSDLSVVLLEPMARRAAFLELCCERLQLPLQVVRARTDEADVAAEVAVARAVAPLDRLVVMAEAVLARPGLLLALKGRAAAAELADAKDTLHRLGATAELVRGAQVDSGAAIVCVQFEAGAGRSGARHNGRRPGRDSGHRPRREPRA
jgi:16S rRNA (guanine527-N7)-methyltransferase